MRKLKTLTLIIMLAMVMGLSTPRAHAGFMSTGMAASDGTAESPGITGPQESPGLKDGTAESPGFAGEMSTPSFDGWIGTGIAALASLFA
jgi:hypothetical protein